MFGSVLKDLLTARYGLLSGRIPGTGGYLARDVFMAVSVRPCRNEKRKYLYGANDSVCSGISNVINDGGVKLNPGTVDNLVQVLCSGCDRNLNSGTQCESCGRWYHNSSGNVKYQVTEIGKWNCDRCRSERLRVLEQKLRDAQIQTEELKRSNKALEEQLQLPENGNNVGNGDTVRAKRLGEKCLVLGDSTEGTLEKKYQIEWSRVFRELELINCLEYLKTEISDSLMLL